MANRDGSSDVESAVRGLYDAMLDAWNARDARSIAELYADEGNIVGFDGSQMVGRAEIESVLSRIFKDHPTGRFIGIVRDVWFLTPEVAVVRAVAGMVPAGQSDIKPEINAVQTLVAAMRDARWRIAVFQNTPAAFHGRPEAGAALTKELREALASGG